MRALVRRLKSATAGAVCLGVATSAALAQAAPIVFDTRIPGQERDLRRYLIDSPRPPYPVSAKTHRRTGSGLYRIIFNKAGRVVAVRAIKSTGHKDLDLAAAHGFYRWRCQPGKIDQIIMPVTFTTDYRRSRDVDRENY